MTLRIGWFTTARGPGSRGMFEHVERAVHEGDLDAEFAFVFSNRERGESEATDSFFDLVEGAGIPLVTCSSVTFRRSIGGARSQPGEPLPAWRMAYDRRVARAIAEHPFDLGVLAGYMLIVERELVEGHTLLNLHPALPDGPAGVWQAVIRQLIRAGAEESGRLLPLPAARLRARGAARVTPRCARRAGRRHDRREPLAAIRARGVEREAPLLAAAIAEFRVARCVSRAPASSTPKAAPRRDVTARVRTRLALRPRRCASQAAAA